MVSGRVKWFDPVKGYGFLIPDGGGGDIFVHFTGIEIEGYRTLTKGDRVVFEVVEDKRGPQAQKVKPSSS